MSSRPDLRIACLVGVALASLHCSEAPAPGQAPVPRAAATDAETIQAFRQLWIKRREVFKNRFLGVSTLQNPLDAWMVQELISEVEPDFLIETGTYHGGSAALWALLLEQLNPEARVITIDIEDRRDPRAVELPISRRRVDFLLGGSTDPEIVAEVRRRVAGRKVMLLLDSLHTVEHVRAELEAYAPLVSPGSYIVVQDTIVEAWKATARFAAENDDFVIDRRRERFMVSNSLGGYLRRVK